MRRSPLLGSRFLASLRRFADRVSLLSPRRALLYILGAYVAVQGISIAVLTAIAMRRSRTLTHAHFRHLDPPDVFVEDNQVKIFSYGADLYDAMLEAIESATERIFIESYIWKADAVGQTFKQRLLEKARAGVEVYVIFDEFGNFVVPESFKNFPPEIHLLRFRPINRPWHVFDPRRYSLDHRKILVVDERVAFLGGYNIGSLYANHWRDTHFRISGPAALELANSFTDFWNAHSPRAKRINITYPLRFDPTISLRDNNALRLTFPIRDMYISAINRAQKHILLTNAYFIPDHVLLESLLEAARRGVQVHILLPWTSNHILADWASRGYFHSCLQAGIHIWGYRNAMIHGKTCTIDDAWCTIGTANIDRLSSLGNYELNAEFYSPALAQKMRELFEDDQRNAFELTSDKWERRPWYVKLSEWALAPLRLML